LAKTLTKKQRGLLREIDQIVDLLHLDHQAIQDYESSICTIKLESMIRQLARGAVVHRMLRQVAPRSS